MNYDDFIQSKKSTKLERGFEPVTMPSMAFGFQKELITRATRSGRLAVFADCGMGKTLIELGWADNVAKYTGENVLIVTVLAVVSQMVKEAEKFGIHAVASEDGTPKGPITITNYEKVHKFNPRDFSGVACDESSILKNFDGTRKAEVTEFMRGVDYRLLASATPAPNDYTELGTSSECLGGLGYVDMLNKYFKNDMNNSARGRIQGEVIKWRFKGHAETPFWEWVSTWSIACRKPSDLGFNDDGYALPPLTMDEHIVESATKADGNLFALPAVGLSEQRTERKLSVSDRCEKAAGIINTKTGPSVAWCHTNEEGDLLTELIPDAVQISGKDSDAAKIRKFNDFISGECRVLVTKPSIGAWGLNFQHCRHMTFFPSHSFEQYYQCVRRFWRFGQTGAVHVDIIATEGERGVMDNLYAKEKKAVDMFDNLIKLSVGG